MFKSITYKTNNILYKDEGVGSNVIIFIHGFLENSKMWKYLKREFKTTHRIITVDLLGHGINDTSDDLITMENQANLLYEITKSIDTSSVNLVGHSMGGYVALAFAELYPNLVTKLCLLNSTALPDSIERKELRKRAITFAENNLANIVNMSVANLFAPDLRVSLAEEIENTKKEALLTSLNGYTACTRGMILRKDRTDVLASLDFESLMIIGEKDPIIPYKKAVKEALKTNTAFEILPTGHMSHIESKNSLAQILKKFLLN